MELRLGLFTLALAFYSKEIHNVCDLQQQTYSGLLGNSLFDFYVARGLPLVIYLQLFTFVMLMFSLFSHHFCFQWDGSRTTYIKVHCFMLE